MADLNEDRCPYCFNKFSDEKYTNDPILIENGSKLKYDNESGLLIAESDIGKRKYKGFVIVKNKHITELQTANDTNKPVAGWTKVEGEAEGFWTPNKQHIKELREAIEKGLGITEDNTPEQRTSILEMFFNYDDEGVERQNPHQTEWNDPTLTGTLWMGNISHMHIEDLRKTIKLGWRQKYWLGVNPPLSYPNGQYIYLKETLTSEKLNYWYFSRGYDMTMIGTESVLSWSGQSSCTGYSNSINLIKINKNIILKCIYITTGGLTTLDIGGNIFTVSNDRLDYRLYISGLSSYLKYTTNYDSRLPLENIIIPSSGNISRNIYNDIVTQFPGSPVIAQIEAGVFPTCNRIEFYYQSNIIWTPEQPTNGSITSIEVI